MPLRISTTLPPELEAVITRTIGCALAVHKELGLGYFEGIYRDAMCVELSHRGLHHRREAAVDVIYRGVPLRGYRVDLLVEEQLIVELKAVEKLLPIHEVQVVSYLKATHLKAALLMNFSEEFLRQGLRRIVL